MSGAALEAFLYVGVPILLLLVGGGVGSFRELRHVRQLQRREHALRHMIVDDVDRFRGGHGPSQPPALSSRPPTLVMAEVVVASDYLKLFLASLRNLVGGEIGSFQKVLERARREAVLRMMEEAHRQGYDALANVRLATAEIGRLMAAVQGSATAYQTRQVSL